MKNYRPFAIGSGNGNCILQSTCKDKMHIRTNLTNATHNEFIFSFKFFFLYLIPFVQIQNNQIFSLNLNIQHEIVEFLTPK